MLGVMESRGGAAVVTSRVQIPCTLCNEGILAFEPSAFARELLFQTHDIKGHGAHFIRNGPNSPLPHSCLSKTPDHASCAFESNAISLLRT